MRPKEQRTLAHAYEIEARQTKQTNMATAESWRCLMALLHAQVHGRLTRTWWSSSLLYAGLASDKVTAPDAIIASVMMTETDYPGMTASPAL
jgi:hypothetical protein